MQISEKPLHKLTDSLLFLFITLVFLVIFIFTFKGFNGTDDLLYAQLSARITQHRFTPFVSTDIFSGRVGLLLMQSWVYRLAGVGVVSTLIPTLLATIACAWLCCFRLMDKPGPSKIIIGSSLFYFTPTLNAAITGILPDIYVTLLLLLLFVYWKKNPETENKKSWLLTGLIAGLVTGLALLFKESAVLFLPFFLILGLRGKVSRHFFLPAYLGSAGIIILCAGLFYHRFTGDFFFRVTQIHNTSLIENNRPGACNGVLDHKHLFIRLTYGPWENFLVQGYITLLFPALLLALRPFTIRIGRFSFSPAERAFVLLLLLILYFPANFQQYQPVCSDPRQFLMLLPFGTVILTESIVLLFSGQKRSFILPGLVTAVAIGCMLLTQNKWKWLTYGLLSFGLWLPWIWRGGRAEIYALCFASLLAVTGLEKRFFFNSPWFRDLQTLHSKLGSSAAWFPDHDNLMNWNLLNGFRTDNAWNLEPYPPPVFSLYYNPQLPFRPGWFIVDQSYNVRSGTFFNAVDAMARAHFFKERISAGTVAAYRIDSPAQIDGLKKLLEAAE